MWFVLGLITLLGGLALGWKLRRDARWKGEATARGEFAFLHAKPKKGRRPNDWRFGIPVRGLPEFRLKTQSLNDALFRRIGISNEVQTGDALFDRTVYVVSDLPVVRDALKRDPELRRRLLAVFDHFKQQRHKLREMRLAGDRLWVRASSREAHDGRVLSALPDLLGAVAERVPPASEAQRFDGYVLRAAMVLTLSTALAISGAVLLFGLLPGRYPAMLEGNAGLWHGSLIFGLPLLAVLVIASVAWLGRSSRTHLILLELLIVGSFGVWAWTFFGLREANYRLDTTPPVVVELKLATKAHWTTTTRRKRGTSTTHHYELRFDRPLALPGRDLTPLDNYRFKVGREEYDQAVEGRAWHFTLRQGRLRWPWIESGVPAPLTPMPSEG